MKIKDPIEVNDDQLIIYHIKRQVYCFRTLEPFEKQAIKQNGLIWFRSVYMQQKFKRWKEYNALGPQK